MCACVWLTGLQCLCSKEIHFKITITCQNEWILHFCKSAVVAITTTYFTPDLLHTFFQLQTKSTHKKCLHNLYWKDHLRNESNNFSHNTLHEMKNLDEYITCYESGCKFLIYYLYCWSLIDTSNKKPWILLLLTFLRTSRSDKTFL